MWDWQTTPPDDDVSFSEHTFDYYSSTGRDIYGLKKYFDAYPEVPAANPPWAWGDDNANDIDIADGEFFSIPHQLSASCFLDLTT